MSDSIANGEEFRDDTRIRRALSPETLRELTRLDPVRSTCSVLTTLAVIAATVAVALTWWEPWTVIPAVIVIATQQHACFVLAHDAAHYRLYRTRWLNDLVGRSVAIAAGVSMCTYRVVHRLHHNHLYEPNDPDIALHGGYPRGRAYLLRKLGRDLVGLTAPKTYVSPPRELSRRAPPLSRNSSLQPAGVSPRAQGPGNTPGGGGSLLARSVRLVAADRPVGGA